LLNDIRLYFLKFFNWSIWVLDDFLISKWNFILLGIFIFVRAYSACKFFLFLVEEFDFFI
jgi:hypothetical protein